MKIECPGCGEKVGVFWRPKMKMMRMYQHKARVLGKRGGEWTFVYEWCPGGGQLVEKGEA